jgi:hypothetical protein
MASLTRQRPAGEVYFEASGFIQNLAGGGPPC